MYPYQRRSLSRMLEIEFGTTFTVNIGVKTVTFQPKGGVVADTVGMGKTAQLIALLLADRPDEQTGTLGALVVSPEHLCHQWRAEIAGFAGDALDVAILTSGAELPALASGAAWRGRGGVARVLVASLEYLVFSL